MSKCPQCGYNFAKTDRKTAVRREVKKAFVKRHIKLFDKQDWHLIVRKARRELGYSDKTVSTDILYGLRLTYHVIKGDILE